ncbi:MAG: MarR family transcriptional regulator [Lachnospiraceae bacterium]|nr:MarR family transcriptional regulator [Lachnospiraceae bacterium]
MRPPTDILLLIRSSLKLYEQTLMEMETNFRLSQMEIKIITFLYNNPGKDTIRDISELRMLPKGNVSQGVESLVQKGLLKRTPDCCDRRRLHLSLTELATPIGVEIEQGKQRFLERIFEGFSEEEILLYNQLGDRVMDNAMKWLEKNHK